MRHLLLASAAAATALAGLGAAVPAFAQSGSYQQSCRTYSSSNGVLTAECADAQGRNHSSTLNTAQCRGDISNQNGMLSCAGGQASGGQLVQAAPAQPAPQAQGQRQDQGQRQGQGQGQGQGQNQYGDQGRQDNRDRRDDRAGAAIAGAVVGALLGPPPVYGDPHYGDPRYDSRYAQGGWGYGRRPGEWVAIRDRADWLQQRIDRARADGRLSRNDAFDLRRKLNDIERMEDRYLRDGRLNRDERADLDHRFDELQARINFEARRDDRRDDRDRGDYRR